MNKKYMMRFKKIDHWEMIGNIAKTLQLKKERKNMDLSEFIDKYCQKEYGHTNWGYKKSYTQEELNSNNYDLENDIVFWHKPLEDDEEYHPDTEREINEEERNESSK